MLDSTNKEPVPLFLIGNKSDLESDREVTYEEGEKVTYSLFYITYSIIITLKHFKLSINYIKL